MAPIEEIFCEIDDYCKAFFPAFERGLLPSPSTKRRRRVSMSAGEIMTILVLFHLSHYRDFKNFYLDCVTRQMRDCFPRLLSYSVSAVCAPNLVPTHRWNKWHPNGPPATSPPHGACTFHEETFLIWSELVSKVGRKT